MLMVLAMASGAMTVMIVLAAMMMTTMMKNDGGEREREDAAPRLTVHNNNNNNNNNNRNDGGERGREDAAPRLTVQGLARSVRSKHSTVKAKSKSHHENRSLSVSVFNQRQIFESYHLSFVLINISID